MMARFINHIIKLLQNSNHSNFRTGNELNYWCKDVRHEITILKSNIQLSFNCNPKSNFLRMLDVLKNDPKSFISFAGSWPFPFVKDGIINSALHASRKYL